MCKLTCLTNFFFNMHFFILFILVNGLKVKWYKEKTVKGGPCFIAQLSHLVTLRSNQYYLFLAYPSGRCYKYSLFKNADCNTITVLLFPLNDVPWRLSHIYIAECFLMLAQFITNAFG